MFPLLTGAVYANENLRRFSAFDPFDQTQQGIVVRLVGRGGEGTGHALSNHPRTWPTQAVSHAGDHEKAIKRVQTARQAVSAGTVERWPPWGWDCGRQEVIEPL